MFGRYVTEVNLFLKMLLRLFNQLLAAGNKEKRGKECGSIPNFPTLKIAFMYRFRMKIKVSNFHRRMNRNWKRRAIGKLF